MEDVRVLLIVVGALGMGGLMLHGLWSIRKQQNIKFKEKPLADVYREQKQRKSDEGGFDEDGIGQVRTILTSKDESKPRKEPEIKIEPEMEQAEFNLEQPVVEPKVDVAMTATETDDVLLPAEQEKLAEDQPAAEPEMVLTLSVIASTSSTLHGAELLPQLLTLGFKFGEMDIFHRHENSAGTGAVLFSLANMVNPGTFDVDSMESFQTPGITLFMTLPNGSDASQTFNMMLSAAQKLARELGGQVIDDTRSVLNNQKIRHYQDRIREYERRKQLNH